MFTLTTALLLSQDRTTGRLRLKCRRVVKTAFGGKLTFRVAISSISYDEAYMKRERRSSVNEVVAQSTVCTTYNYFPLVVVVALFTPIVDNMAFYRNVFSFIVIFAALPNITSVLPQLYCILRSWMPSAADLIQELVLQIHKYCKERIFEDIQQEIARIIDLVKSLYALVHFALQNVFAGITDTGLLLHNNGMGHTDEILQQVLGYDG